MKLALSLISLIILLLISGCTSELTDSKLIDLKKNICTQDSDCWSTNGVIE
ncbi:MAG: hypothetical protein ABIC91_00530 [Nanoarchaeota archaeon]|nr:hypothetical protein [Nanoarchaeota archaeon]MBU1029750.1 hypothetical protein [Nanoarchaeota archaeon]